MWPLCFKNFGMFVCFVPLLNILHNLVYVTFSFAHKETRIFLSTIGQIFAKKGLIFKSQFNSGLDFNWAVRTHEYALSWPIPLQLFSCCRAIMHHPLVFCDQLSQIFFFSTALNLAPTNFSENCAEEMYSTAWWKQRYYELLCAGLWHKIPPKYIEACSYNLTKWRKVEALARYAVHYRVKHFLYNKDTSLKGL